MTDELVQHRVVSDERQSRWMIRRTFDHNGHKLRTTIHHDPYEFQADYYLEVFNKRDLAWNRIHTEAPGGWYKVVGATSTGRLTPERWEQIDALAERMLAVGQDLLDGVEA